MIVKKYQLCSISFLFYSFYRSTVESSHLSAVRRENNVSPQPMQRIQRYESDMGEDIWEIAPPGHTPMPQGITKRVVEYRGTANMNNKLRNDFFRAMSSSPTPRGQHSSEEQQKSGWGKKTIPTEK